MKNWIWLHCFGLYTTVMSSDESILEVMHDYRDWCFATLYMLDQACSLCIKMQQSNKVFTFVHVFINGINFVDWGEFVCVWHCLYLSCHKLVCIVMIYLDPPKSQPPVHFFLKYLDPSEMFYPLHNLCIGTICTHLKHFIWKNWSPPLAKATCCFQLTTQVNCAYIVPLTDLE